MWILCYELLYCVSCVLCIVLRAAAGKTTANKICGAKIYLVIARNQELWIIPYNYSYGGDKDDGGPEVWILAIIK